MRRLVVLSTKGGVGKSTVATGIAARAAQHGKRVLVVDSDPTATATRRLRGVSAPARDAGDVDALVEMLRWAAQPAGPAPGNVDLTGELGRQHLLSALEHPAGGIAGLVTPTRRAWGEVFALASPGLPLESWAQTGPTRRGGVDALGVALRDAPSLGFDLVVVDTAPTFGFLTTTATAAATDLLLVVDGSPEAQSGLYDGLRQVILEIDQAKSAGQDPPRFLGIAVTKRPTGQVLRAQRATLARLDATGIAPHVVATYPQSSLWARAAAEGEPITAYTDNQNPQLREAVSVAAAQTDHLLARLDASLTTPEMTHA